MADFHLGTANESQCELLYVQTDESNVRTKFCVIFCHTLGGAMEPTGHAWAQSLQNF